ncbi:hypothetical protein OPQ81_011925 [Rhizoctonia solani]|nr:hypothetical protein OPQ81_011925 [Rhizoctonia solani]
MLTLSRIASILLFVLSLSFLTCAAPTPKSDILTIRGEGAGSDAGLLLAACVDVRAKVVARADDIVKTDDLARIKADIDVVVDHLKVYADLAAKVNVVTDVDAKVKAEIAAHLIVILKAVVKISASLISKLSLSASLDLIAKLQVAVKLVIDNLNVCIVGFIDVFVKLLDDAQIKAVADVHLNVLIKLFLSIRAKLGLNVKIAGLTGVSL